MNEQQTRELAKQYRERAAIMEASKWVDGICVNVEVKVDHRDWQATKQPIWYWKDYEYRIVEPDEVRYYAWKNEGVFSNTALDSLNLVKEYCRQHRCNLILKVTTKPDGTKGAEFIAVGK